MNFTKDAGSHKYLEIIRQADTIILLYSDNGTTITKEIHTTEVADETKGFLKVGAIIETVTVEKATGTWADRYTLTYSAE